ncbi:Uncharacterized conserved protein YjbJ, UPF0337 family [Jatrophihabitans endophyticus]|uniref:Uncharacterized conserved protein YjbJ, UPF0337 family n=1 Tax=Jatrophihabitans endophyticus TaxID=1206085 RepID=A0A1M5TD94_9ACTN|nr:Uncharacterized conserved protein YjbJ, UPF0337 family [Jatrophihabitans endophyticus]
MNRDWGNGPGYPPVASGTSWGTGYHAKERLVSATDKIKNAIEDVEGKAKEALGRATGDRSTENEGKTDQSKADLKNAGENVKDAFKH